MVWQSYILNRHGAKTGSVAVWLSTVVSSQVEKFILCFLITSVILDSALLVCDAIIVL
jgi:hypothetical protein